jgi:hypothetical protein
VAAKRGEREVYRATIGPTDEEEATLVLTERRLIVRSGEPDRRRAVPLAWITRVGAVARQVSEGTIHGVEIQWLPDHAWRTDVRRLWVPCRDATQCEDVAAKVRAVLPRRDATKVHLRRHRLAEDLDLFVKQYARKKPKRGGEPNDRDYDWRVRRAVERMDPEELDALLRQEYEDDQALGGG